MAKLPSIKRVLREDVKEAPNWIERILLPMNTFFESVYQALNKNITFTENIACQVKDIKFTTSSTYSSGDFEPLKFVSTLRVKASGLILLQIFEDAGSYVPMTQGVHLDWVEINGTININHISGLDNSKTYYLKVLLI